jgi:hypothetical protein
MPINELEIHPFLEVGESIPGKKMIIGTFPIYALTNPRNPRKDKLMQQKKHLNFFYGSVANYFWQWYIQYIDSNVISLNRENITSSLYDEKIGISDVIIECKRTGESFNDSDLRNKRWNLNLAQIIEQRIESILVTSKSESGAMGWLIKNILLPSGFLIDSIQSLSLQKMILNQIPQSNPNIKPVAAVLVKEGRYVRIVSLPSPGSPKRQLVNFGYRRDVHSTDQYLNQYLTTAFEWFKNQ